MDDVEALTPKNHRLKRLRKLVNQSAERKTEGVFVVEGPNLVTEVLASANTTTEIFLESGYEPSASLAKQSEQAGIPVRWVVPGGLTDVLSTVTPQPVAAVVERRRWRVADLSPSAPVLVLVDGRDPGNVGALCRTAEAAGFAGLVLGGSSVDPTNPKVIRAASGATLRLPVVVDDRSVPALFDEFRAQGRRVLATTVTGGVEIATYDEIDLTTAAIVLGNEANGLDDGSFDAADQSITIELAGPTESLNVAAAGAVLCFEALRQMRRSRRTDPVG